MEFTISTLYVNEMLKGSYIVVDHSSKYNGVFRVVAIDGNSMTLSPLRWYEKVWWFFTRMFRRFR